MRVLELLLGAGGVTGAASAWGTCVGVDGGEIALIECSGSTGDAGGGRGTGARCRSS